MGTLLLALLLSQAPSSQSAATPSGVAADEQTSRESTVVANRLKTLASMKRIYVESFGEDKISQQMQAMIVSSLTSSDRFVVTEEKSKADVILKGVATEKTSQEVHAYGSGTSVATAHGGGSSSLSGSNGYISGSSSGGFAAAKGAISDSSINTETIDSAHASVRLLNSDGDVVWTSTQESNGAKYKGASADVADKIVKQLIRDAEKASKALTGTAAGK